MTQIKSEKAKQYIASLAPEIQGENSIEIIIAKTAIQIAETEAEERHAKEVQELRDKAVYLFRDFVVDYAFEAGHTEIEKGAEHYVKIFTQKLNEQ